MRNELWTLDECVHNVVLWLWIIVTTFNFVTTVLIFESYVIV